MNYFVYVSDSVTTSLMDDAFNVIWIKNYSITANILDTLYREMKAHKPYTVYFILSPVILSTKCQRSCSIISAPDEVGASTMYSNISVLDINTLNHLASSLKIPSVKFYDSLGTLANVGKDSSIIYHSVNDVYFVVSVKDRKIVGISVTTEDSAVSDAMRIADHFNIKYSNIIFFDEDEELLQSHFIAPLNFTEEDCKGNMLLTKFWYYVSCIYGSDATSYCINLEDVAEDLQESLIETLDSDSDNAALQDTDGVLDLSLDYEQETEKLVQKPRDKSRKLPVPDLADIPEDDNDSAQPKANKSILARVITIFGVLIMLALVELYLYTNKSVQTASDVAQSLFAQATSAQNTLDTYSNYTGIVSATKVVSDLTENDSVADTASMSVEDIQVQHGTVQLVASFKTTKAGNSFCKKLKKKYTISYLCVNGKEEINDGTFSPTTVSIKKHEFKNKYIIIFNGQN